MRYSASYLALIAIVCLAGASQIHAQVVGQPYRLNDKEVERILTRIENQTKTFRKSLDRSLDRSRLNGTHREDDINGFMKAFEDQTKHLRDRFKDHKSVAADVEAVLDRAASIDAFMVRQRLSGRAQEDWSALRGNLDELAQAYNVSWRWGGPVSLSDEQVAYPAAGGGPLPYRLTDREVEQILDRIERQSDRFRSSLDSSLDRSRLDGTRREDDINAFIKDFNDEVKRLHDRFSDHKSVAADVQSVLDRANRIDEFMSRNRVDGRAREDWSRLRSNLDELSQAYSVDWRWRY
jgi:DNA repair exonuclease SbcCD ATPase subunit